MFYSLQHELVWIYVIAILFLVFVPLIPSTMDFFMPLNESRPKIVIYHTEYLFDSVEYSWVILLHQCIISPFPTIIIIATGSLYCNCCQHACGMFEVIGYVIFYLYSEYPFSIRFSRIRILVI